MAATVSPGLIPTITNACTNKTGSSALVFTVCAGPNGLPAGTTFTFSYSSASVLAGTPTVTSTVFTVGTISGGLFSPNGTGTLTLPTALNGVQCGTVTANITPASLLGTTTATLAGEGATNTYTFGAGKC